MSFHDVYGLKLVVHDVDCRFGEAEIERNRREIIARLESDGILHANQERSVRVPALRIGLVTAKGSAAYNDFVRTLSSSPYAFEVRLANAAMQGDRTGAEVTDSIRALAGTIDVICVVRGGGSQLDLASLDNEQIARTIATCGDPVFVGIGHEIDHGVLDVVANRSFKTPTAVAEELVRSVRSLDERIVIAAERLKESVDRRVALVALDLERNGRGFRQGLRKHLEVNTERHLSLSQRAQRVFDSQFSQRTSALRLAVVRLRERAPQFADRRRDRLNGVSTRIRQTSRRLAEDRGTKLARDRSGFRQGLRKHVGDGRHRLTATATTLAVRFERAVATRRESLNTVQRSVTTTTTGLLTRAHDRLLGQQRAFRLDRYLSLLERLRRVLQGKEDYHRALGPKSILRRGYSLVRNAEGHLVRNIAALTAGDRVDIEVQDGVIESTVDRTRGRDDG